jgi:hypothetical protein
VSTPTDSVYSFSGWIRQGRGRWKLFCRAATEQACLDELLKRSPLGVDKLVRAGDSSPNDEPVRKPRRYY